MTELDAIDRAILRLIASDSSLSLNHRRAADGE
jgi:DNA-binding Lrp family transcriptional regulator